VSATGPNQKPVDDYEYKVRIHEVDPQTGNVTLVFEEIGGNDGFGVTLSKDQLRAMISDGTFDDWAKSQVENRIKLLKQVEAERQAREQEKQNLKDVEELLKRRRFKRRRATKTRRVRVEQ